MKQYICLNSGECNWADETPPREFPLPSVEDLFCPNCGKNNIKEKPKPPGPPWPKVAGAAGLLVLILGIIWYLLRPDPTILTLKAESNCETGLITLIAEGGDGSPVIYSAKGLRSLGDRNIFQVPRGRPHGSEFILYAIQKGDTTKTEYTINCPEPGGDPDPEPGEDPGPEPGGNPGPGRRIPAVVWTKVPGSEFCVSNCLQSYSETDNLGHTRERKMENCADCQMDEK